VGNKLLDNLAAIFWFLPPYLGIIYFWLSGGPQEDTATLVYYLAYAISATVLSGGYWLLCRRAAGKVAAWLVSVAYAETFFAITLWGIIILIIINIVSPGAWGAHDREMLAAISRGLVGFAVGGTLIASLVLIYGFLKGQLDRPIAVFPFGLGWGHELPQAKTIFVSYKGWEELPEVIQEDWRTSTDEAGMLYVLTGDGARIRVEPGTGWYLHRDEDGEITVWKEGAGA
jgi:hypothetical protein